MPVVIRRNGRIHRRKLENAAVCNSSAAHAHPITQRRVPQPDVRALVGVEHATAEHRRLSETGHLAAGAPIAAMWFADRQMGPSIIAYGRPDQQKRYLPGILSGETTWSIGMLESNAGSDLVGLVTSAVRDGDEFVINGQKIWTSFGEVTDFIYLICRTSTSDPPHDGISEIVVPRTSPGIEVRTIQDMTPNRHFCEVFFTDVKQTMSQLEHERGGIDRLVPNRALYTLAVERADTSDPIVRQRIAAGRIPVADGLPMVPIICPSTGAHGCADGWSCTDQSVNGASAPTS